MFYAIEIVLDYTSQPYREVHRVWSELRSSFLRAGFLPDGRSFRIHLDPGHAGRLARITLAQAEARLNREDINLYRYLRHFYGYPVDCVDNLLLPGPETIEVNLFARLKSCNHSTVTDFARFLG
ncbi:MAG TPA: hypothetical protein VK971_08360 [Thiohalobacter sp.]|nr:hypothetical protein [Thiohalobacter sp.]